MYTVNFKFEQKGVAPVALRNVEPGQSILELAIKNNIELHHNCGGICSCTTCHLYIEEGMEFIDELSSREKDFIRRIFSNRLNSRLGCQALLMGGHGEMKVIIPDQTQFSGE
jgi:ferredoxin, 2Fe-2S